MIETKDLILDKAKFSDWEDMYRNVWSRPECNRYMTWRLTENENDAKIKIRKVIEWQKDHDTYIVYEKSGGKAIGYAGVAMVEPYVYEDASICLGADYIGKGFGKQILAGLIRYVKEEYRAKEFRYSTREKNIGSRKLAEAFGFVIFDSEIKTDERDGQTYTLLKYRKPLVD